MDISNYPLGLGLVLAFGLIGFAFSFHFWRYRYETLTASHVIELNVPASHAAVISRSAMEAIGIRNISVDSTQGCFVGHTGLTKRSLGTKCRIDVRGTHGGSSVVCHCRPRAELVLTDWGARTMVLDALVSEVDRLCANDTAHTR